MNFERLIVFSYQDFFTSKGIHATDLWKNPSMSRLRFYWEKIIGRRKKLYAFDLNILKHFDKAIIVEPAMPHWVIEDFRKANPSIDIKCWMTNIVADYGDWKIRDMQKMGVEIFSFDRDDCLKYDLTFGHNLYRYDVKKISTNPKFDCYFVGKDKNRLSLLDKLAQYLTANGSSFLFKVVRDRTTKHKNISCGLQVLDQRIAYEDIINDINNCRCIVDLVQQGQRGATLRPFESLFYDKKLITNNLAVREYKFYHPNNIFVIENDSLDGISEFLKLRQVPISDEIKKCYDYISWLNNFWK